MRSYYRNRIDFGDITAVFYDSLEKVLCDYFDIKEGKFEFGFADKNKKLLKKKIDIDGLSGKEELILNKIIDAKYFDQLDEEKLSLTKIFSRVCLAKIKKERLIMC